MFENIKKTLKKIDCDNHNNPDGPFSFFPCKRYIVTGPQNPVDNSLETTPFKDMDYMQLIK